MAGRTIEMEWQHLENFLVGPESPGERETLKQAFYAGAHRMYYAIAAARDMSHAEASEHVRGLQAEIDANAVKSMATNEQKH